MIRKPNKRVLRKAALGVLGYALFAGIVLAIDAPHAGSGTAAENCAGCHNLHGSQFPTLLGKLCQDCHGDFGVGNPTKVGRLTHSSRHMDADYGNWEIDCWSCHDPHAQPGPAGRFVRAAYPPNPPPTHPFLRIKTINPSDPGPYWAPTASTDLAAWQVTWSAARAFVDGDANTDDDVCVACHTSTAYYNRVSNPTYHPNLGVDSQPGGDCTVCHPHDLGFVGISCDACHNTVQGVRRQVVTVGGDFERASHHVNDGSGNESVEPADCMVCHRIRPDTAPLAERHRAMSDPSVLLNLPDTPGATVTFNGAGSSVETFCVTCHDDDGPAAFSSPPFTDGQTPTNVKSFVDSLGNVTDPNVWKFSVHSGSSYSPLTSDKCMACHGGETDVTSGSRSNRNMHGSPRPSLLSTRVDSAATANAEESLCYACHDGSGMMAGPDMTGVFAKTYRHPIVDAEQTGISVECTDCHNPHAAQTGTHTAKSNIHGAVLRGVTGVYPAATQGGALAWNVPAGPATPAPALQPIFYFRAVTPSAPVPTGYRMSGPAPTAPLTDSGGGWAPIYMEGAAVGSFANGGRARPEITMDNAGLYAYRSFVSGDLAAQTIGAGNWSFGFSDFDDRGGTNDLNLRAYVYVMNPDTTVDTVIFGPANIGNIPNGGGAVEATGVNPGAVAVQAGDRLVAEFAVEKTSNSGGGATRAQWNRDNKSYAYLDPPGSVNVSADPGIAVELAAPQTSWSTVVLQGRASGQPHDGDFEGYACLKCHSSYNGRTGRADVSLQFNPNNAAFHNVLAAKTIPGVTAFVNGWSSTVPSKMTCSDCHSNDTAGRVGPHGSGLPKILKDAWTANTGNTGTSGDLCFGCHDYSVYSAGSSNTTGVSNYEMTSKGLNLHWLHMTDFIPNKSSFTPNCQICHVQLPHGYKNRSLLASWLNGADPINQTPDPITQSYAPNAKIRILNWGATAGEWSMSDCEYYDGGKWQH